MRLEVHELSKTFRVGRGSVAALRSVSCCLSAPGVVGLVGPNGSGKSTFIRCLAGLIDPDGGYVALDGVDITDVPALRRQISALLEGSRSFYWNLTGRENLYYFAKLKGLPEVQVDTAIRDFRLQSFADRPAGSYSRGMQQRLALAIGCLGNPKVLLLDEPTHGLDQESVAELEEILDRMTRETQALIVVATHDHGTLHRLTPQILAMYSGELVTEGLGGLSSRLRIKLAGNVPCDVELPEGIEQHAGRRGCVLVGRLSDAQLYTTLGMLLSRGVTIQDVSRLPEGWVIGYDRSDS